MDESWISNVGWFFVEITDAGNFDMWLDAEKENGDGADIDFVLWGPFADYADAVGNCNNLKTVHDCSYMPDSSETV